MILLDTHTLLWWMNGDTRRLSAIALAQIEANLTSSSICVSSISTWEIALLVEHGRFSLAVSVSEWIAMIERLPSIRFVPIDNAIALASNRLPEPFHRDSADRFIVATARLLDVPLVTVDRKIRDYPHVKTIW